MINLKFQKRILFIPLLNVAILFIVVFYNSKCMKKNWFIKSLVYCTIILVAGTILLYAKDFVERYIESLFIDFLFFYAFTVVCCSVLIHIQKRFLTNDSNTGDN